MVDVRKLYVADELTEAQVKEIKRRIRLSMNGVTADSMVEKGLKYKQNFGVELMVLRQIAASYQHSSRLADRLWMEGWRETMIVSVLVQPVESCTHQMAIKRAEEAPAKEITDILCLYLLRKVENATALCMQLITHPSASCQVAGLMLAVQLFELFTDEQAGQIIEFALAKANTESLSEYAAIAACLSRMCRRNSTTAGFIAEKIKEFSVDEQYSKKYIAGKVMSELEFLNNL